MITPELIEFIKKEEAKGVSRESIVSLLRTQSWTEVDIMEAFDSISPKLNNLGQSTPTHTFNSGEPTQLIQTQEIAKSRSFKKTAIVGSIIAVFVFIVGGFIAYASGYIIPFKKMFTPSLQTPGNNLSSKFSMHINIDGSAMKNKDSASNSLTGFSDTFDFDISGSNEAFDIKDSSKKIKGNFSFLLKSGTFEAGFESRLVEGSIYVNLTKAPNLGIFSLKPFENKWIAIPEAESKNLTSNPLLMGSGIEATPTLSDLTQDQKNYIVNLTEKASFIKITKNHLPVIKDGTLLSRFEFDIDKEGIIMYFKDLTTYLKSIEKDISQIPDLNNADFEKTIKSLQNIHGEVWIGTFDKLLRNVNIDFDIVDSEKGNLKVKTNLVYSDWGKPVVVEIPKETTTIEKLMSEVMGSMFGVPPTEIEKQIESQTINNSQLLEAKSKGQDASIKSIENMLRAQAEVYYSTSSNSYKGFCSSKGQYGAYTLATTLPNGTVYKCNDSVNSWASWSKLSTGEYFCVDSTGIAESILGLPQGTSCPSR